MSGHESWGSKTVVCFVFCMLLNDDVHVHVDDDDDDDDDADDAIACRESRPEGSLLSSPP